MDDPEDRVFLQQRWLDGLFERSRATGVAIRDSGEFNPQTSSIAVPIMFSGNVLGCVSMIWIRTAMSSGKAVTEFATR